MYFNLQFFWRSIQSSFSRLNWPLLLGKYVSIQYKISVLMHIFFICYSRCWLFCGQLLWSSGGCGSTAGRITRRWLESTSPLMMCFPSWSCATLAIYCLWICHPRRWRCWKGSFVEGMTSRVCRCRPRRPISRWCFDFCVIFVAFRFFIYKRLCVLCADIHSWWILYSDDNIRISVLPLILMYSLCEYNRPCKMTAMIAPWARHYCPQPLIWVWWLRCHF